MHETKQLELNLHDPSERYRRFRESMVGLLHQHGVSEAVCAELRNWAEFHDFPTIASWCRHLLRDRDLWHYKNAANFLECFGIAFRGDMVGHIGRDLLGRPLSSTNLIFRGAAVNVLVRWLEHDEDGMWLDMAEDHLEREEDPELHRYLQNSVMEIVDDLEEDQDEGDDPLLEEFLELRHNCDIELKGTAPILRIKPLLCQLTGLQPPVLGSIVEYLQFPPQADIRKVMDDLQYSQPAMKHLGVLWSEVGNARHLRVWDMNGSFAFSVEPTASCDDPDPSEHRYLFFCYLR